MSLFKDILNSITSFSSTEIPLNSSNDISLSVSGSVVSYVPPVDLLFLLFCVWDLGLSTWDLFSGWDRATHVWFPGVLFSLVGPVFAEFFSFTCLLLISAVSNCIQAIDSSKRT